MAGVGLSTFTAVRRQTHSVTLTPSISVWCGSCRRSFLLMATHLHAAFSVVSRSLDIFYTICRSLRSRCPTASTMISHLALVPRGGSSSVRESLFVRRVHFLVCAARGSLEAMVMRRRVTDYLMRLTMRAAASPAIAVLAHGHLFAIYASPGPGLPRLRDWIVRRHVRQVRVSAVKPRKEGYDG